VHLLASGSIMQQALAAMAELVTAGLNVCVWSITSFTELERDALACARWSRLHPTDSPRVPYVQSMFSNEQGVFVAVTDYMKKYAAGIGRWLPGRYEVLGTDGYGLSESRAELRRHFEVDAPHIVQAALSALFREGLMDRQDLAALLEAVEVDAEQADSSGR
jgi:pyruvate dehydrogenase E1 component